MDEEEIKETKITEFLDKKIISNGKTNITIAGGANEIRIKEGVHKLNITSNVKLIHIFGGTREINIKSKVDDLIIIGGSSKIYVHNYKDTRVNKIDIKGGKHNIIIYSLVNELIINGGITEVHCNYEHSRINRIKTVGGQRKIILNGKNYNVLKKNEAGAYEFQKTEILPEPIWYQYYLSGANIPVKIYDQEKKIDKKCSICLNCFNKGEKVYYIPCQHIFHINCLKIWVLQRKICPNCKTPIANELDEE